MRILNDKEMLLVSGSYERPYLAIAAGGICGASIASLSCWAFAAITEHYFLGNPVFNYALSIVQGTPFILIAGTFIFSGTMAGCFIAENCYSN